MGGVFWRMWAKRTEQKGLNAGKYISVTLVLCMCRQPTVTHGPHIGAALGETFPSNDVILCTAFDPLSAQGDKMMQKIFVWKFRNALKSNLKKIIYQFHTGKSIWIYHLKRGTILSYPQSNAAKTWPPFQVSYKLLYLIQISPEVRNEIENVVFKIEVTLSLPHVLTQQGKDNMADILQTTIANWLWQSSISKLYIKMSSAK